MGKLNKQDIKEEQSDWNMGSYFYEQLAIIKSEYMIHKNTGDLNNAILRLEDEIDWIGADIPEDQLKNFRVRIDNLRNRAKHSKTRSVKNFLFDRLSLLKRDVWDAEGKANITRPKNNIDLSNTPVAYLNNR